MSDFAWIIGTVVSAGVLILALFMFASFKKEQFKNERLQKEKEVKDFDKRVIDLTTLKQDDPKLKDFKPKKTSELDLFCKNNIDGKPSCYRQ